MNNRLSDLKATLVDLYETEDKAIALVDFIIDMDNVNTQGAPNEIWHSILKEAKKQDKVKIIVDKASEDYKENSALQELVSLDWSKEALSDDSVEKDLTAEITIENTLKKINNRLVSVVAAVVIFIGAITAALNSIYDFTDTLCKEYSGLLFCPDKDKEEIIKDINPIYNPVDPPEAISCQNNQIKRDNSCLDRIDIKENIVTFNGVADSHSFDLNDPETLKLFFGEIFITGIDSTAFHSEELTEWEKEFNDLGIGGIMINVRNLRPSGIQEGKKVFNQLGEKVLDTHSSKQIIAMIDRASDNQAHNVSIPRFIAVDHEGGNVSQLMKRNLTSQIPSPMGLSSLRNLDAVSKAARIAAEELQLLGVNMKLGPVVDINAEKENRDIRDRSFGDDPDDVTALARAEIEQNNKHSIISVIKHYPGHGHTVEGFDTPDPAISYHLPATIKNSMAPFRQLKDISPAIMTSHMQIQSLNIYNATTDHRMVYDILRKLEDTTINNITFKGIEYRGLIMTDDLNEVSFTATSENSEKIKQNGRLSCPEDVAENYLTLLKQNTLKTFDAGHDLLLFSHIFSSDKPETDYINKSHNWCARWATSLPEFKQVYEHLYNAVFPTLDNDQSLMRQNQLRDTLKRIFQLKNNYLYTNSKQADANALLQTKNKNRLCVNKLLKSSITFMPAINVSNELHMLRNLSADHNVVFYSFINNKLNQALSEEIIQRLKYRYHRNIIENLKNKVGQHYQVVTLKKNPVIEEGEHEIIADNIITKLSETENPTHVIFYIDQYYQSWTAAQIAIKLIMDNNLVKPEYIHTIFARNPVVLFDTKSDSIQSLRKTNLYILYSAYEEGSKLQIDNLFASNGKEMSSSLPIKIQALNPVVSSIDTATEYQCD